MMIDQFEAAKRLNSASIDNLLLMILDDRLNPQATPRKFQMVQIPGIGLTVGATPRGSPWEDPGFCNGLRN